MLRDLLRGAFRAGLGMAGLALFAASPLFGQASTGKVQGRVTDAGTGAPISGAQVLVEGTTLGNLTNDQGFYFINEVPAGLQNVRSQFIGYRPFVVEGQRILAGQTTTMNFELEQTAVELEAITVEGERNPLVPRDQTSTKSIVQGAVVDQLPLDNATNIVVLQPGVVQTNSGRTIRGGRANEEAVFIDGVLVRSFGQGRADNVNLPTNALEQVDVNIGAFSAEFGEGQSGVVSFVTRSGGPQFTGSLTYFTDQVTNSWRINFNRAELTLGGPIFGPLTFFFAGTANGRDAFTNQDAPTRYVVDGIDSCPSGSQYASLCDAGDPAIFDLDKPGFTTTGAVDVVPVAAPNFVPWDNARTVPSNWNQGVLFSGNLNWQLPRGSRVNFSYTRNRNQTYGIGTGFGTQFNPDNIDGTLNTKNVFTLGWFQTITQSAEQQLALDLRASYQTDRFQGGMLDPSWWQDNQDPFLGFTFGNIDFMVPEDFQIQGQNAFDFGDELVNAYRSGAITIDSQVVYPQRLGALTANQGVAGVGSLRYNPYGRLTGYNFGGTGVGGLQQINEDRLQLRGTIDWQLGRFNRIKTGVEYMNIDLTSNTVRLYSPSAPIVPEQSSVTKIGAFLQDRLDIGDLVLEGGIRFDYLDPGVDYSVTPGFVFNVPDSLQAGYVRYDPASGTYVDKFDTPCGGVSASNPNGTCQSNFIEAQTKSEFSPRLGASFPVTPTSTFRLSYGRFVQTPAFFTRGDFAVSPGVANNQIGFLQNTNLDLSQANQNATWGRDVDMPSTRTFEFGYRQLVGTNFVIDVSAFNKKQRALLSSRNLGFPDPNTGANVNLNVVTNNDFTETNGFEVKLDKAVSNLFTGNLSYTFLDARGTGSDPKSSEDLILRSQSNVSNLLNQPENPPELLLRLEQSRRHNIAFTSALAFPVDYMPGSVAGAIFRDFGWFAILTVRSGLPFTKLVNIGEGQHGPPSQAGLQGIPQGSISNLETSWTTTLDFRFTKGFQLGQNWNIQAFVDWRNPFNLTTNTDVFLETGGTVNEQYRNDSFTTRIDDPELPAGPTDIDIIADVAANDFNKFMLLRAEERFGDGDGVFTVEEQDAAFMADWENANGQKAHFETSNQLLRLGFRVAF